MIRTRQELEDREHATLASYAQFSGQSAGRAAAEPRHPHRTEYQRDRARIIHSRAFRRLEYKTQVFLNGTGDHLRTRLTHTMEVASVSRSIAGALGLNEDLAEAIALAHDLGHAPFGHSGEETLNNLMSGHGGFEHNRQSLRIVEMIETRYPRFRGLNLSFEVLEGLSKHHRFYEAPGEGGERYPSPSLEAQIADLADEITYYSHDLDDGLDYDLIDSEQLNNLEIWRKTLDQVCSQFPDIEVSKLYSYVIRCLIDNEVGDVVQTSDGYIVESGVGSVRDVRRQADPLIRYSDGLRKANRQLREFLYANMYYHPRIADVNQRACRMLRRVFERYVEEPQLLGKATAGRLEQEGVHRTVCDYLSGMTDRYLLGEYARLFPGEEP